MHIQFVNVSSVFLHTISKKWYKDLLKWCVFEQIMSNILHYIIILQLHSKNKEQAIVKTTIVQS